MINMKIDFTSDKIIIYLYRHHLTISETNTLNREIKELFIKIIKKYNLNFFGYSKVIVYDNEKYGSILEIIPIINNDFNFGVIDLKIVVYKNIPMYLVFDNYYSLKIFKKCFIKNNKYYLNINDIDNINKYIELGEISYQSNI